LARANIKEGDKTHLSQQAYYFADAMLAERNKGE